MVARREQDLPREEICRLLDMSRAAGIRKVLYSGGEPFLREDFLGILEDSHGISTSFVTNGSLITDAHFRAIHEIPHVRRLRFSIDGFDGHDTIRRGSSWRQVLDRIAACRRLCPRVSVVPQTTATPATLQDIPTLLERLQSLGVDRWRMFLLRFNGRMAGGTLAVDADYYERYVDTLATVAKMATKRQITMQIEVDGGYQSDLSKVLDERQFPQPDGTSHPCQYLLHVLMVRNNGDISVCPFFDFGVGNIADYASVSEIETAMPMVAWRNLQLSELTPCHNCRYALFCKGGCRKTAFELRGSYRTEDPVFCRLMPLLEARVWPELPERVQAHYAALIDPNGSMPPWQDDAFDDLLAGYFRQGF